MLGDDPDGDNVRRERYEQAASMQDWPRPQSPATLHMGATSWAVTQTPPRQVGPEEFAQPQSMSTAQVVRHTALTHSWPAAHWAEAVH